MGQRGRRTVDPEAAQAERRELIERLERGFQRIQESDEYRRYLDTVSRFHQYSISNTMLIWMQRPEATHVAGFRTWLSLGRHVLKGERGIRIFAPMSYRRTMTVTGQETGEPEQEEIHQLRFRAVSVFDISQTDGEDLAQPPVTLLSGDDESLGQSLATIATAEGLTIDRAPGQGGAGGANGWYARSSRTIWVDPDLAPVMAGKTLCHELAHHFAEHIDSRQEHETIAESVAYIVLGHFGIDASDYSFGYLASWSDAATFKAKLADIQTIAGQIIERIEGTEKRSDSRGRDLGAVVSVPDDGTSQDRMETRARSDPCE
jgi:antirestriction protein ArdC